MRHRAPRAALLALVLAAACTAAALSGCRAGRPAAGPVPAGARAHAGHDPAFLARGECAGRSAQSFTEVSCRSAEAAARVLARYNGPRSGGPRCPGETDFVLHIDALDRGTSEESSAPEGYACMRNLQPPHPGDPGMGGGPLTVTGDCLYTQRDGVVKETACDGSGARAPEYRITTEVGARRECPPSTDLYVQVGGGAPVGCARRLS
ncbi:hypothetical protein ACSNOH_07345 [Streptomyces sp. URMC 127]|uniref:hypothetical protein n=1 Tax=Streptomyces sp. URMC 127 TaxID=3423402 RepID=UPI003F1A7DE9